LSEKEQEQIDKLKEVALKRASLSIDYKARESAVIAIAAYGNAAIPVLIEISQNADSIVQKYALDSIAKIKAEAKAKAEAKKGLP
jgi:hypothetical protein